MKKILFVCRYNRFRSILAEGFFNKFSKNKSLKAKSAGVIKGSPLGKNVKQIAKNFGLKIKRSPSGLTSSVMKWQNITVLVAHEIPPELFDKNKRLGKTVIVWKIKDVENESFLQMQKIANEIQVKVKQFLIHLNKE